MFLTWIPAFAGILGLWRPEKLNLNRPQIILAVCGACPLTEGMEAIEGTASTGVRRPIRCQDLSVAAPREAASSAPTRNSINGEAAFVSSRRRNSDATNG